VRLLFIDFTLPQLLRDGDIPVGGWAVQLKILLIALSKAGHKTGVLAWKGASDYVGPQSICDILDTYDRSRGIKKLRLFYYFIPSLIAAARAYNPDVIVQSCAALNTGLMAFVARILGVPFVHRLAADSDVDDRCKSYLTRLELISFRYGLKNAKLIICQNGYQEAQMRRAYPAKRLLRLKNAVEVSPASKQPCETQSKGYIAWAGGFRYQKNLALLNRIARELPSIQFRVAGVLSGPPDPETTAAIAGLSQLPNVQILGYVKRASIFEFLAGARALLSTSRFEGFSNTFLEALACGTPVIAPSTVDPDSMIADNDLGLIAREDNELVSCVRKVYDLSERCYTEMSLRCRQYVEVNHESGLAVRDLIASIEPLIRAHA